MLAGVLGAFVLCAAVLLSTAWNTGLPRNPVWPDVHLLQDPTITFDAALKRLPESEGRSLDRDLSDIEIAASLDPLDGHPYFFRALREVLQDPAARPVELLETARKRSPRLREARLLLLDVYGRSGRMGAALEEAQALSSLLPSNRTLIVRLVSGLVQNGESLGPLAEELGSNRLAGPVLLRLASQRADVELLERVSANLRGAAYSPRERQWIASLVGSIAERPDIDGAARLWALFHDVDLQGVGREIFDPEFSGRPGTPPFGWNLNAGDAGTSRLHDGWLEVYYYGRLQRAFASQLLRLPPGRYRMTSNVETAESRLAEGLAWQVSCNEGGEPLSRVRLESYATADTGVGGFTVPAAGCAAQYLQLVSTPGIRQQRQWASIESVKIEKITE